MKINFYTHSSEFNNSIDNFLFTGFFNTLKTGDLITVSEIRYEIKAIVDNDAFVTALTNIN